jgi:hypothetical protein
MTSTINVNLEETKLYSSDIADLKNYPSLYSQFQKIFERCKIKNRSPYVKILDSYMIEYILDADENMLAYFIYTPDSYNKILLCHADHYDSETKRKLQTRLEGSLQDKLRRFAMKKRKREENEEAEESEDEGSEEEGSEDEDNESEYKESDEENSEDEVRMQSTKITEFGTVLKLLPQFWDDFYKDDFSKADMNKKISILIDHAKTAYRSGRSRAKHPYNSALGAIYGYKNWGLNRRTNISDRKRQIVDDRLEKVIDELENNYDDDLNRKR